MSIKDGLTGIKGQRLGHRRAQSGATLYGFSGLEDIFQRVFVVNVGMRLRRPALP